MSAVSPEVGEFFFFLEFTEREVRGNVNKDG